ncbi:MAG: putative signal transducing protein [Gemmatimonadales bacterium]
MTGTVTVFASSDPAEVITAKLILDSEGIRYVVEGEGVQDLFGFGRAMGPFNPITGPVQLRVAAENAERALEALEELRTDDD